MKTKLIEFKNRENETLRGILTLPEKIAGSAVFLHGFGGGKSEASRRVSTDMLGVSAKEAVFLQGFERNATVEKKFKSMAGALAECGIGSLRYDAAGCGLSDGDFSKTTLKKRSGEILAAFNFLRKQLGLAKVDFVAHSVGMCPLAMVLDELEPLVGRMVFIAPALNQKNLMRYYFVRNMMKRKSPKMEISWLNYKQYLDEAAFLEDCREQGKMVRENYIDAEYFLETKDLDFTHSFDAVKDRILHVHGECDRSVPLESLDVVFPHKIIVPAGDHDLERPDFWELWFPRAVEFLAK